MPNLEKEVASKLNGKMSPGVETMNPFGFKWGKMSRETSEKISGLAAGLVGMFSGYMKTGRDFVRRNPTKGVAIAMAAGAVVGSILVLSMRPRRAKKSAIEE